MQENRYKTDSQLVELLFNAPLNDLLLQLSGDILTSGTPSDGTFIPILTVTAKNENEVRFKITWKAKFVFKQNKNINEGDLFGGLKSVLSDMEQFLERNNDQFGILEVPKLEQYPNVQKMLYGALKTFYEG
jgi:hypothetical protein